MPAEPGDSSLISTKNVHTQCIKVICQYESLFLQTQPISGCVDAALLCLWCMLYNIGRAATVTGTNSRLNQSQRVPWSLNPVQVQLKA